MKKDIPYKVEWIDTFSEGEWLDEEDIFNKANCRNINTVGYYIGEKNGYTILARNINHDPGFIKYGDPIYIPTNTILKWLLLQESEEVEHQQ